MKAHINRSTLIYYYTCMSLTILDTRPAPQQLTPSYLIDLSQLSAIVLSGKDQKTYLQGQVTCDVLPTTNSSLTHGAHCDAKGKVYAVFRLLGRDDSQWLIQPKTTIAPSLTALQKFGVFAKVAIKEAGDVGYFALIADHAEDLLKQHYQIVPDNMTPVVSAGAVTIAYLPGAIDRYLVITEQHAVEQEMAKFNLPIFHHTVWTLLDIIEGFPILSSETVSAFVPQMLNVQAIHGISFTKGCYLGQETVARMQYLGKNKRALYCLTGSSDNVAINDTIEIQLGEQWKRAGTVQACYQDQQGTVYLQAVLASDADHQSVFRIKEQTNSLLHIHPLPYSL